MIFRAVMHELVASTKTTGFMMIAYIQYGYVMFGTAFSQAICVIVKYFGTALLKTGF